MKKGMTLIELLIVIAFIGILLSIIVASVNRARQNYPEPKTDGIEQTTEASNIRTITAYSLDPAQTDDSPCIGAWGDNLCEIQADKEFRYYVCASNEFERGTKLRIRENFIVSWDCIVLDRMNERYPTRIDILMDSQAQALNFGIKESKVKVLQ